MVFISLIDTLFLVFECYVFKKYFRGISDTLIPLICVLLSLATAFVVSLFINVGDILSFYIYIGLFDGLAAVGLNQLYRQTRRHILVNKARKKLKRYRKLN